MVINLASKLGAQARKPNEQVQLPTMSRRLASLRTRIAKEQICRILKGPEHAKLRSKLLERLLPAA